MINTILENTGQFTDSLKDFDSEVFFKQFKEIRRQTIELVETLEIEDFVVQSDEFTNPPKWHLGHTSWFFEQILRKYNSNYKPFKHDYTGHFATHNIATTKPYGKKSSRNSSRPTVSEITEYWRHTNMQVSEFIHKKPLTDEIVSSIILGFNHEWQHQELLICSLLHLLKEKYKPKNLKSPPVNSLTVLKEMVRINGGIFEEGFDNLKWNGRFAYNIEMPVQKIYLNDYFIDNAPVTNSQYIDFINNGGYENYEWWLEDGWEWLKQNNISAPLYWEKDMQGKWIKTDFRGKNFIENISNEPVLQISYYEADAYSKWAGKRLPSEAEWEKAASWDEKNNNKRLYPWGDQLPDETRSNMLESKVWSPTDIFTYEAGKSAYGCYGMLGDCWEWTQTEFMPYPGYKTGSEFNNDDKWFGNRKVLRGGSFATPRSLIRNTYRNYASPQERWLFCGFRCAKDSE
jgi:ergothioneine biosynthesis protein EgtB